MPILPVLCLCEHLDWGTLNPPMKRIIYCCFVYCKIKVGASSQMNLCYSHYFPFEFFTTNHLADSARSGRSKYEFPIFTFVNI